MKKETTTDKSHKKWVVGVIIALFLVVVLLAVVFYYRWFFAVMAGYGVGVDIVPVMSFYYDFLQVVGAVIVAAVGAAATIVHAIGYYNRVKTERDKFQHQADIDAKQFNQAENRMHREQLVKAAELMAKEVAGKPAISARVSGINAMGELASAEPETFLRQTVSTMVAYIKDNARVTAYPPLPKTGEFPGARSILGEDVKAAFLAIQSLHAICGRDVPPQLFPSPDYLGFSHCDFSHLDLSKKQIHVNLGVFKWEESDLSGVNLHEASLDGANFTGAILHGADLSGGVSLHDVTLTHAQLQGANLEGARIYDTTKWYQANLSWASLRGAILNGNDWDAIFFATDFSGADVKKCPSLTPRLGYLDERIWRSRRPEQPMLSSVVEQNKKMWDLEKCRRESTSALVGACRNFSGRYGEFYSEQSINFRKALPGELPADFPNDWREWLENAKQAEDSWGIRD